MDQKLKNYLLNAIITYYIVNSKTIRNLEKQNSELAEIFIEAIDVEVREAFLNYDIFTDEYIENFKGFDNDLENLENILLEYSKNILNKNKKLK